ncbi:MAG: oligoribonuclease [Deltaproteobacteria bacterium HGW-Deltaproteobacteria-15]|nr:MAG: oligoribonuclease [Deltaproteobacteria bacterium HGW-Deltaproteobacteria-15]
MSEDETLTSPLIWIDLEMTGLDPERCVILEIATLITDGTLEIIAEGPNIPIHYTDEILLNMEPWSNEQHRKSGLFALAKKSDYDCGRAEKETIAFLSQHCSKGDSPLCGNSVWQDRRFLIKYMPELESFLHYRNVDVSSIKELVQRWYPSLPAYDKPKDHLAMSDIRESVKELRYYREKVFLP